MATRQKQSNNNIPKTIGKFDCNCILMWNMKINFVYFIVVPSCSGDVAGPHTFISYS